MVHRIVRLIIVGLILSGGTAVASDSGKEAAAVSAAEKWLATVDAEQYAASWKEAAEVFRNTVRPEQWEQSMQAARKPLGKLISRKVQKKSTGPHCLAPPMVSMLSSSSRRPS